MCEWKPDFEALNERVDTIETRLSQVEHDVGKMRTETQECFHSINTSITNLAHDFGTRMNNLDKRIIEEKEKWGTALRTILLWGAKALIIGAMLAMGINIARQFFDK